MSLTLQDLEEIEAHLRQMEQTERRVLRVTREFADQMLTLIALCRGERELSRIAQNESRSFRALVAGLEGVSVLRAMRRKMVSVRARIQEQEYQKQLLHRQADRALEHGAVEVGDELQRALRRFLSL